MTDLADISCQAVVELVTEYLDGALDPATTQLVEHHLELCPGCLNYVEQMRTTTRVVGQLKSESLDPAFRARLLDSFREWR